MPTDSPMQAWQRWTYGFARYVLLRFGADGCPRLSAGLTFTSLLAMVPLLAVGFAIFSAFPAFDAIMAEAQSILFENLVPEVGSVVQENLLRFMQRTHELTALGALFLFVTTVLLLATISRTFNDIWRIRERRSLVSRFLVFWAVVSLAPILFGASMTISSYLFAAARDLGVEEVTGPLSRLTAFLPFLLQVIGFALMYLILPDHLVRRGDALIGALVAGILLAVLKRLFGLYLTYFPAYETIYGALATIPIFLVWTYLVWMVVLIGAEITAALPEWRTGLALDPRARGRHGNLLTAALVILDALHRASQSGETVRFRIITAAGEVSPLTLIAARDLLEDRNYIARGHKGEWLLARDLDTVSLWTLYRDLDLDPAEIGLGAGTSGWQARLSGTLHQVSEDTGAHMAMSLKDLLRTPSGPVAVPDPQGAPRAQGAAAEPPP